MSSLGYPQDVEFAEPFALLDGPLRGFYDCAVVAAGWCDLNEWISDVLGKIFGWTSGATIGTLFTIAKRGELVGTDEFGNRYYQSRDSVSYDGRRRRWVTYNGYADASKVPPDWHGWLHYTYDELPTDQPLPRRVWEQDHLPNLTGTPMAWRPQGSLAAEGQRPAATGDYEAWRPE